MKNQLFFLFCLLVISCKTTTKLTGEYQANLSEDSHFTFNFNKKTFSYKKSNGSIAKGKFKIINLSSEKTLLVCNNVIFKKGSSQIKEVNSEGDSIYVGNYFKMKNYGSTVFELTKQEKTLTFRKTYTNELQKTENEGVFTKK